MKKILTLLLLVILTVLMVSFANSKYDWTLVRDQDGIQIYLKEYWADKVKAFKGVVEIEASIGSLLAVITDIKACSSWVHHCRKPALLLRKSFSECYHYQLHYLPFPALNREFIFYSRIRRIPQTGEINIDVEAQPEFCTSHTRTCDKITRHSAIRVQHSHGQYHLEPIGKKMTRVTWIQHTDPGGHLPHWLINTLVRDVPYKTLKGLRALVTDKKYRHSQLLLDKRGQITGIKRN